MKICYVTHENIFLLLLLYFISYQQQNLSSYAQDPLVAKLSIIKSTDHYANLWQRLALTAMQPTTFPFDNFCPYVQKDLEIKKQCEGFRSYFASATAVDRHVKRKGCESSFLIPVVNPAISM